jgi:putative tricarboxylic transport membrane protein
VKLNDAVWGVLLLLLSTALLIHVQSFPRIPGQNVGPGLFPGLLAVGFGICGVILIGRGVRARLAAPERSPWVLLPAWIRSPPQVLAFAVLIGVNLFYVLAVERLGFIPTGIVYLAALTWILRVPLVRVIPIAILMTLAIHYCFYKLLKVPLPWGLLQSLAW